MNWGDFLYNTDDYPALLLLFEEETNLCKRFPPVVVNIIINDILGQLDIEKVNLALGVGFLRTNFMNKDFIPNWYTFRDKLYKRYPNNKVLFQGLLACKKPIPRIKTNVTT